MIRLPNHKEYQELKSFKQPFCLTVYAPFIEPNSTDNPNRIELKNLLREAEIALRSAGLSARRTEKTIRPARELLESHEFWPIQHESLALFMHPKLFRCYHLPDGTTPYLLTVERGFNLEPLETTMLDDESYFVLALSHKNVKLFRGDRYKLQAVHLKNLPSDMVKELKIDEFPNWRETHAIAPAYMGKGSEAYHGQYNVSQTDKDMLLRFFRRIDTRLHPYLRSRQSPLILAGVSYLAPIYRKANTFPYLLSKSISGNTEHMTPTMLHSKAWSLVSKGEAL